MLLLQCKTQQEAAYAFPAAMAPAVQVEFAKQCDKGKILYEINCGQCHNIKVKRKMLIPDFTTEQLIGYELRIINQEHESRIPETTVTTEELGYILTFLGYKTKSGKPFIATHKRVDADAAHTTAETKEQ